MSDDNMQLEEVNQSDSPAEETSNVVTPVDWDSLDGSSQERFQRLANAKKEAEQEVRAERSKREETERRLRELESRPQYIPMPKVDMTQDEQTAYKRLTDLGVADRTYVQQAVEKEVAEVKNRLYINDLHQRLEREFGSDSNLPKYDRDEVEKHMTDAQIFDPKAAYRDLYHDEIVASEVKKLSSNKKTTTTERTKSRIGSSNPWTRESLAERLRQPDGIEFYKKNQAKIMRMQYEL